MLTEHASKGWIPLSVSFNFVSPTPVVRRPRHYVESHINKKERSFKTFGDNASYVSSCYVPGN